MHFIHIKCISSIGFAKSRKIFEFLLIHPPFSIDNFRLKYNIIKIIGLEQKEDLITIRKFHNDDYDKSIKKKEYT